MRDDNTYTADEAFALMEQGVWMECGGYTLRNHHHEDGVCGEYLSGDKFVCPATIRTTGPQTIAFARSLGDRWRRVRVTLAADLVALWEAGRTIGEIARELDIPPSDAYRLARLVASLRDSDWSAPSWREALSINSVDRQDIPDAG